MINTYSLAFTKDASLLELDIKVATKVASMQAYERKLVSM